MLKRHLESTRFLDDQMAKTTSGQSDFFTIEDQSFKIFLHLFLSPFQPFFYPLVDSFFINFKINLEIQFDATSDKEDAE